ncbi:MAG: AMP-binding protein, partial [Rhodospirillales bacterium]|nr:AMP-binding protein [Rhodospirillales bacterium]
MSQPAPSYVPSYVHGGAASAELLGETIGSNLARTVARFPDRPALIVPGRAVRWSYAELARRAEDFAAGLLALGLEPGDRIGIWSPNNPEWVIAQFATAMAGLILVNINPAYRLAELEYALNKVECRALITATAFKTSDYVGMLNALAPELAAAAPGALAAARLPSLRLPIQIGGPAAPGFLPFARVADTADSASRARLAEIGARLQFDDPINIQF